MRRASWLAAFLIGLSACSCEKDPEQGPGDGGADSGPQGPCGNGVADPDETCDDGNVATGDGCNGLCRIESGGWSCPTFGMLCRRCGDGQLQPGEVCDDGNTLDDGCNPTCNGVTEPGYHCDVPGQPCQICGDSVVDTGETCDDGNFVADDGCSAVCQTEPGYHCDAPGSPCIECGNGVVEDFETCEDGNIVSGDGCSAVCQVEPGWDCFGASVTCTAAQCGDGIRAGVEGCDDGNKLSGDGCNLRCAVEPGYVCIGAGIACRHAMCGDSAVEAQETCDDGNTTSNDGCSDTCRIESGHACPTPGEACVATTCGNGVVEGIEQCDDHNVASTDGCSMDCELEAGFHCPTPGQACTHTTCGDGMKQGTEACDDHNTAPNDGCSAACAVEAFYECSGALNAQSSCHKPVEFVRISRFPAPMHQPQAVNYDPMTQSFIAYGFNKRTMPSDPPDYQEFCLDGTHAPTRSPERPRALVGDSLDGAAYDPFSDTFLFVLQTGSLEERGRPNYALVRPSVTLSNVGVAGGIQVGDDGRYYVTNHHEWRVYVFDRPTTPGAATSTTPVANFDAQISHTGTYLDNIFNIPGQGWIGYYNVPPGGGAQQFAFHRYDGSFIGRSTIPGVLFANGDPFPANADGGEAAADGGYFLVCSEYDDDGGAGNGICQLFARRCSTDLECANRIPGTACNMNPTPFEEYPYCYNPARARNDFFQVGVGASGVVFDVLRNDQVAAAICSGGAPTITNVSMGSRGGTIVRSSGNTRVTYTPPAGLCGVTETFTYGADLLLAPAGQDDSALVTVFINCVCGNGELEAGEQCDDDNTDSGDGCSPTCRFEPACGNDRIDVGEECDDGNTNAGDGCSPNCTVELE